MPTTARSRPAPVTAFVPLRVRSHGSLLDGTASPAALVAAALARGYDALALTDRDNLYLAIAFWNAARAEGLAPLPGAEVTAPTAAPGAAPRAAGALLIPFDRRGWASLCAVLTARHLDPAFDLVRALGARHAGLHVVVETAELAAALIAEGVPPAEGVRPARWRARGAAGGVWLGVRGLAAERATIAARAARARALGVPVVATGDVALLSPRDHDAHRAAVTAAAGELLERMPAAAFAPAEAHLATPAEWERRVRATCAGGGAPEVAVEALANNRALVARCRLELELGTPVFPRAPLPDGVHGPAHLARLCRDGVRRRYGGDDRRALARLDVELAMIERMGFTDYFLLVAEIVGFARARGIPTVGRGSGASSIVSYVLGITNVDPLRHQLAFERFLNPSRRDCPDLDIDLCWKRRDDVIAHVYRTYGDDRVAMISTHATLGARSAFRETAKALGVSNARVNALARRIPREMAPPYRATLERMPEGRGVDWSEPVLARALELAERLDGAPRHLSVHCGGIVIADRPLTWYLPLQRAAKDVVVTQFEMRAVEAMGLVKMDLLGNRALSTIGECVELVRARHGVAVDVDGVPNADATTAARVRAGDTLNCFQLESPAMRHLLRMLDCRTLDDTIAAVALVRPGPAESGMKEAFCRRRRGLEPATFLHPRLEPVLAATHGVMLYEEDVMRVAAALAGLSMAEGDDLRRAIGAARGDEAFRALERGFVAHAARAGVDGATARRVWVELTRFAAYAFCKAHAAGYGALGWQSAYLKARFPAEYAVGILNHHAGMYPTWVHVEDLRRRGVRVLAPCVQRSAWDTTLEVEGAIVAGAAPAAPEGADGPAARRVERAAATEGGPAAVRVGLSRVFGLTEATGARIVAERARRPFRSLADVLARVRPSLPEAESLVLAGALDWIGRSRPSLKLEARVTLAPVGAPAAGARNGRRAAVALAEDEDALLPDAVSPLAVPALPEFDAAGRVHGECAATGMWFSAHPLDAFTRAEDRADAVPAASLEAHVGRRVALVGLPCASRRVETKQGGQMLFVTLGDASGIAECVLFPDAYRAHAEAVRASVVRVEGRVEETLGAITLTLERARALA